MASNDLPLEHAAQLLQLLPRLARWAREWVSHVGADMDLSMRQYSALRGIQEGARSATELARRWQVTPAVVTGVIDRLERRGLVRREADPGDRRRLFLALTAKGQEMSRSVDERMTRELAAHLAGTTPADLLSLGRTLDVLNRALGLAEQAVVPPPVRNEGSGPDVEKTDRRRPTRHPPTGTPPRRPSRRSTRP